MTKKSVSLLIIALLISLIPSTIETVVRREDSRQFAEYTGSPKNVVYRQDEQELSIYWGDGLIVHYHMPLTTLDDQSTDPVTIENHYGLFFLEIITRTLIYTVVVLISYVIFRKYLHNTNSSEQ